MLNNGKLKCTFKSHSYDHARGNHNSISVFLSENLTLNELLSNEFIQLNVDILPPNGQKLFELFFHREIFPFIEKANKHLANQINTRRNIIKLWDLQKNDLKNIYIKRSNLLKQKWNEMRKNNNKFKNKNNNNGNNTSNNDTNNNSNKKKANNDWKKIIEMQIANGEYNYDIPRTTKSTKHNNNNKKEKDKDKDKDNQIKPTPIKKVTKKKKVSPLKTPILIQSKLPFKLQFKASKNNSNLYEYNNISCNNIISYP
mmetsp:Transcript_100934/g.123654  ORF Transcript_100934/g.123654 Transcript_100934/m.123654 type:complete len:256 (+) Transcript_100934:62-829(+)